MSAVPDAWDEEWSSVADQALSPPEQAEPKKVSAKVTKAQKRAQQAEFNRQLWAEAEGPKETNYFLESRNVVPLRTDFKPPTVLLSRKGPVVQSRKPPTEALGDLDLSKKEESSEDEDELKDRELSLAERQARAAKDREEKQRKYDERRQELFGSTTSTTASATGLNGRPTSRSGNSSPASLTPPGSRSSTPSRGRGRGGRRGGMTATQARAPQQQRHHQQPDLYEPTLLAYSPKPDSTYLQRRENGAPSPKPEESQTIRAPKGPDGSGRGGFGFVASRSSGKQAPLVPSKLEPTAAVFESAP